MRSVNRHEEGSTYPFQEEGCRALAFGTRCLGCDPDKVLWEESNCDETCVHPTRSSYALPGELRHTDLDDGSCHLVVVHPDCRSSRLGKE